MRDYFVRNSSEVAALPLLVRLQMAVASRAHEDVTLLTESGYLMLVKSLSDDLAWNVQRQLVKSYFATPAPALDILAGLWSRRFLPRHRAGCCARGAVQMSTTMFDQLVAQSEIQHQKWLAGALMRQTVPTDERLDFAIAAIYAGGSLAAGVIETEAYIRANAKRIYDAIVAAAEAGGFTGTDKMAVYFQHQCWTPGAADIAANMVDCIGGPEAFIDLFDLAARAPEAMGGMQ